MGGHTFTPWQGGYQRCKHVQEEFPIGNHTLLITGGHDIGKWDLKPEQREKAGIIIPTFGVYMDSGWQTKLETDPPDLPAAPSSPTPPLKPRIETYGGLSVALDLGELEAEYAVEFAKYEKAKAKYEKAKAKHEELREARNKAPKEYLWPFMWMDWPDRGIVDVNLAEKVVTYVLDRMHQGDVIDIGCAGAHGRAGTLLAMLLIDEEKLQPGAAIEQVRKRHCKKAIESDTQVKAIFGYAGLTATPAEVQKYK